MVSDTQSLPHAIGDYVRDFRKRHGVTREALARAGSAFGMTWGRTSIENIESGRAAPTIPTLYVLCLAMRSQLPSGARENISLLDLLPSDGQVEIGQGYAVPATRLRRFLGDSEAVEPVGSGWDDFERSLTTPPPPPTLAEERAARRLGVSVSELQGLALEVWGEPLDRVVRNSTDESASAQARGHETRRRIAQLRDALNRRHDDG